MSQPNSPIQPDLQLLRLTRIEEEREALVESARHHEKVILNQEHGRIDPIKQGRQEIAAIERKIGRAKAYQKDMGSADDLLRAGERVQTDFDDLLMNISTATNGALLLPGLKDHDRIVEKIEHDYAGDANGVLDVVRGSIIFDTLEDLYRAVEKIHGLARIVRVKDHISHPTDSGYRDLKFNIELADEDGKPYIAEIQFHLSRMHDFKEWENSLYKERRKLIAELRKLQREEGDPDVIEKLKKKIFDLRYESQSVYAQVWEGYSNGIDLN